MPAKTELLERHCRPQLDALNDLQISEYLQAIPEWKLEAGRISRSFEFKNYYRTMAFVNAIAFIFHTEDHHPDLLVTYKRCVVTFSTHSVNAGQGGLSENDFICAAKTDAAYGQAEHQA